MTQTSPSFPEVSVDWNLSSQACHTRGHQHHADQLFFEIDPEICSVRPGPAIISVPSQLLALCSDERTPRPNP